MLKILFVLLCLGWRVPAIFAQWNDRFEDADILKNPTWFGDTARFKVNNDYKLHLNAPAVTGSGYLTTSSSISLNASWSFFIRMDFNPSSSNYARIYLMSDHQDLTGPLNGYFLRIGYSNDDLCLFKQNGKSETLVIDGRDKIFNTDIVQARIKVDRDESGAWTLRIDSTGGEAYSIYGVGHDQEFLYSQYFGLRCFYTSTRSTKFFFDDFVVSGETYVDPQPFSLLNYRIIGDSSLSLMFSKAPDTTTLKLQHHLEMENNELLSIHCDGENPNQVMINCKFSFTCNLANTLHLMDIRDTWNQPMKDTIISFTHCFPELNDIVFNEVMADPVPVIRLPEAEYVELYNRSDHEFELEGFSMMVGDNSFLVPEFKFSPHSYLLLCSKSNELLFSKTGKTLGIFSSSTTFSNEESFLQLKNKSGQIISRLNYSNSWFRNVFKSQGGWSLEQVDPMNPCAGEENWKASESLSGGTPGTQNSVWGINADVTAPNVVGVNVLSPEIIELHFNETLDSTTALLSSTYSVTPDLGQPIQTICSDFNYSIFQLSFSKPMVKNKTYELSVKSGYTDCAGNRQDRTLNYPVGIAESADSLDVVINEVMYHPKSGGAEYIELYNRSEKIIDMRKLLFGIRQSSLQKLNRINDKSTSFYPHTYLLLISDVEKIKLSYSSSFGDNLLEMADFPTLDDLSADLVLLNDTMGVVDEFVYSEKMQSSVLRNTEGVALERISINQPAWFPGNWHSASETSGYGTPGYQNSQSVTDTLTNEGIRLPKELFSPDNDGYEDLLQVNYSFKSAGCRAMGAIFDSSGRLVKKLFNNLLMGTEGCFFWDGTNDAGRMCNVGLYLLFLRTVYEDGKVEEYKKTCVIAIKQ